MPIGTSEGHFFKNDVEESLHSSFFGEDETPVIQGGDRGATYGSGANWSGGEYDNFNRSNNIDDRRREPPASKQSQAEGISPQDYEDYMDTGDELPDQLAAKAGLQDLQEQGYQNREQTIASLEAKIKSFENQISIRMNGYDSDYNTSLGGDLSKANIDFHKWASDAEKVMKRDLTVDDYDYDIKGYWKENRDKPLVEDQHFPDTFKKPNHMTFSEQSRYSNDEHKGGTWGMDDQGKDTFTPGPENLRHNTQEDMERYFKEYEPNVKLIYPDLTK